MSHNFKRFIDRPDHRDFIRKSTDFHHRVQGVPLIRILLLFGIVLLATIWLLTDMVNMLVDLPVDKEPPQEKIISIFAVVVFCALSVGVVAVYMLWKIRHNITATEFQTLVFASCMRVDSDFCLVVHEESRGMYCDYNFSKLFADYDADGDNDDPFHWLLASQGFSAEDEASLVSALREGKAAKFSFTLNKGGDGGSQEMEIKLDPIERPKGFFLLRGRKI